MNTTDSNMIRPASERWPFVGRRVAPVFVALAMGLLLAPVALAQEAKTSPVEKQAQTASPKVSSSMKRVMRPADRPALEGYCPVAYFTKGKAVRGDAKFRTRHQGQVYYLSSAEAKKSFEADPAKYLPQFGGLCATALGGSYGNRRRSDPTVFDVFDGELFLFSSERAKRAYEKEPKFFIYRGRNVFSEPAIDGYCPVAYQLRGKALKGNATIKLVYGTRVYQFVTEADRDTFVADPVKYLPAYGGYCAEGVSKGRRYPADARQYVVRNGRTYLFFDAKAQLTFLMNPEEYIRIADKKWASFDVEVEP